MASDGSRSRGKTKAVVARADSTNASTWPHQSLGGASPVSRRDAYFALARA